MITELIRLYLQIDPIQNSEAGSNEHLKKPSTIRFPLFVRQLHFTSPHHCFKRILKNYIFLYCKSQYYLENFSQIS
jgi:hypothetical protein